MNNRLFIKDIINAVIGLVVLAIVFWIAMDFMGSSISHDKARILLSESACPTSVKHEEGHCFVSGQLRRGFLSSEDEITLENGEVLLVNREQIYGHTNEPGAVTHHGLGRNGNGLLAFLILFVGIGLAMYFPRNK